MDETLTMQIVCYILPLFRWYFNGLKVLFNRIRSKLDETTKTKKETTSHVTSVLSDIASYHRKIFVLFMTIQEKQIVVRATGLKKESNWGRGQG